MKNIWQILMCGMLVVLVSCGSKQGTEPMTSPQPVKTPSPEVEQELAPLPEQPKVHKIGLLLPLSGPHAELGKGMLNASEMALFDTHSSSIILIPQDTNQGANQAVTKAVDQGAELILGPIFAAEVESVQSIAKARQVNLLAFSTDTNVAKDGTYILGLLPSQQIQRIVAFAKEKGLTRIAALTPDDAYGRLIDQTLKDMEIRGDIQLLGTTHYEKGDLLEGNPGNIRITEEVEEYKSQGVQALVIPEGGENLSHIMNLLVNQKPLTILGSGQWDAPQTLQVAHHLKDAYFVSTDPKQRQSFESRFEQAYGYIPPRIATLAYDATALSVALADQGYSKEKLTTSQGFTGIEGLFRLTPQGLNERGYVVLQVTPAGFQSVNIAPQAF